MECTAEIDGNEINLAQMIFVLFMRIWNILTEFQISMQFRNKRDFKMCLSPLLWPQSREQPRE